MLSKNACGLVECVPWSAQEPPKPCGLEEHPMAQKTGGDRSVQIWGKRREGSDSKTRASHFTPPSQNAGCDSFSEEKDF